MWLYVTVHTIFGIGWGMLCYYVWTSLKGTDRPMSSWWLWISFGARSTATTMLTQPWLCQEAVVFFVICPVCFLRAITPYGTKMTYIYIYIYIYISQPSSQMPTYSDDITNLPVPWRTNLTWRALEPYQTRMSTCHVIPDYICLAKRSQMPHKMQWLLQFKISLQNCLSIT